MKLKFLLGLILSITYGSVVFALPPRPVPLPLGAILCFQAQGAETRVPRVGDPGVVPPEILKQTKPDYPEKGKRAKIQGSVILDAVFKKNKKVANIKILKGIGDGQYGFEDAAIKAMQKWIFKPGTVDGQPADIQMTLKLDFILGDSTLSAQIQAWTSPDLPDDNLEKMSPPEAFFEKPMPKPDDANQIFTVDVEISANGVLLNHRINPEELEQSLEPDGVTRQIEAVLKKMIWVSAKFQGQGYRTLMRLKIGLPVLPDED